jgi:hypothetical protein
MNPEPTGPCYDTFGDGISDAAGWPYFMRVAKNRLKLTMSE